MFRSIIALLILSFGTSISWGQIPRMEFEAHPPDWIDRNLLGYHGWTIFASGEIDANAAKRLSALVDSKKIPEGSWLYLNSPGGSLLGGIALGRSIRKHGLDTAIGQFDPTSKYHETKPGYCFSACATAFLGGVFRYWTKGSIYGVHRFFWKNGTNGNAALAQIISATLVEYIRSMGVDTKIFSLASEAGPTEVITPSHQTLLALNVVNDGQLPTKWTIKTATFGGVSGMYLRGERQTANGVNKFMIDCIPGAPVFLMAIFDVGENAKQVMSWPVNWLFLDDGKIRMDRFLVNKDIVNGKMVLTYRLNRTLLNEISKAKTVGIGLQGGVGAAV